jgi:hypothetical protein
MQASHSLPVPAGQPADCPVPPADRAFFLQAIDKVADLVTGKHQNPEGKKG